MGYASDPKYFQPKWEGHTSWSSEVSMIMLGNFVRQFSAPRGVENNVTRKMLLSLTPWSFNTPTAVIAVAPVSI